MQCESLGPRLSAWVDGELNWLDAWLVARHVASCPTCAAEVEDLRALNLRLAAANPVFTPLEAPIRTGGPIKPLLGVGALVATGVLGFFLLPRPQEVVSLSPTPTPVAKIALASPAPERNVAPAPVVAPTTTVQKKVAPTGRARSSMRVADAAPRTEARSRRVARRFVSRPVRTPRKRVQPDRQPLNPIQVAEARVSPMEKVESSRPLTNTPTPAIEVSPELDSTAKGFRRSETLSMAGPPAPTVAAKPAGDVNSDKAKRDAGTRTFGAAVAARAITPPPAAIRENADALATRKRVVPVLVVTPTRYENVVTVTAGAIEVDDTDNDEEETAQP